MEKALSIIATIFCYIAGFIYNVFRYVYRVFNLVASAKLVDNDVYRGLARNIYVLIGVIALFLAAYSLLTAIADPEGAAKSKNSPVKLVQNVLITIVLIAFVPTIFNFAFNVQGIIMKNNLIGEVLTVDGGEQTISDDFANSIWNMFYKVDPEGPSSASSIHPNKLGPNDWFPDTDLAQTQEKVSSGEKTFLEYARYGDAIANQEIDVDWLLLIGMGCACVYLFISFSIDMGVRAIKLAFYQIIAPIPILTRIIPGQNKVFDNWLKGTMSTFFEVFIRVGAVALGVTLINFVFKWNITWVTDMSDITGTMKVFAQAILIIGILIFIKQAPKFICDMFGIQSGSFKLGIADKLGEMAGVGTFAKDTLNSAKGAVTGTLGAGINSFINNKGFRGLKNNKDARDAMKRATKMGFYNGLHNKGNQFTAQFKKAYSEAGLPGEPSWFGGQDRTEKWSKNATNAYSDYMKNDFLQGKLEEIKAREDFKKIKGDEKDLLIKNKGVELEAEREKQNEYVSQIAGVEGEIAQKRAEFEVGRKKREAAFRTQQAEIARNLQARYDYEREGFEADKQVQIATLRNAYDSALQNGNHDLAADIYRQMETISSRQFENFDLKSQIEHAQNAEFVDTETLDISELESKRSSLIDKKTETDSRISEMEDYIGGTATKTVKKYKPQVDENGNVVKDSRGITVWKLQDETVNALDYDAEQKALAGYSNIHPNDREIISAANKRAKEELVSEQMKSDEAQLQRAIFNAALKDSNKSASSGDKK